MKKTLFLILAILFCLLPGKTRAQTDSVEIQPDKIGIWYFGIGGGNCNKGIDINLSFTITSPNYWGGGITLMTGIVKSNNIPPDYYEGGLRASSPKDYLDVVAFNFVKIIPIPKKSARFGFEVGPSWVRWNVAEFELNPNYDPDWPLPQYKYYKSHVAKKTVGLTLITKVEFPLAEFVGVEFSIYSVINNVQSVIGLNLCLDLGKVKP
jgi:hypothetical protein